MKDNKKRVIITYGTFDLFHIGHTNILERAAKEGDYLIVGLSTDSFNLSKGKEAYQSFEERRAYLNSLPYVDEVFEENSWDQKPSDFIKYNADVFIMGSDWEGKFNHLETEKTKIKYFPRTKGISSTQLREQKKNS